MPTKKNHKGGEKFFTFGKTITTLSLALFIGCIIYAFTLDPTSGYDTSLYCAIVTATGSLAVTCLISYMRKAQAENLVKLNMATYKQLTNNRLQYNKSMLMLRKEYGVDQSVIDEIDAESDADDFMEAAKDRVVNEMNEFVDDSHAMVDRQSLD